MDFLRKLSDFFDPFSSLAKYAGILGISIGLVFLIFKGIIVKENLFSTLTKKQSYNVIRIIILVCFIVFVLSLIVYCSSSFKGANNVEKISDSIKTETLKMQSKGVILIDSTGKKK